MTLPIFITIPHGEIDFPEDKKETLTLSEKEIQESYCDYGSNELFASDSFHVLKSSYSRLFCDINRAPDNWSHSDDLKLAGVVRQKTEAGKNIYHTPLTEDEKKTRLQEHQKFYSECSQLIEKNKIQFFVAGHTMEDYPSEEIANPQARRPDIVISTNNFQTCDESTALFLRDTFVKQGFTVKIDTPFLGGHLLTHFCDTKGLPGVQIEVRRGLFSTNAHEINESELKQVSKKIEQALLVFWEKFLTKGER